MLESGFFYGNFIDSFLNPLRKKVAMKIPPGQKIIDIACGTGAQSFALADKSNEVVGIDLSESMIRFARRKKDKMKQNNVQFLIADASDLSIFKYHSFDVAIMSLALHQFNPELYLPVLSEMKRLSKTILILDYAVPLPCNIY